MEWQVRIPTHPGKPGDFEMDRLVFRSFKKLLISISFYLFIFLCLISGCLRSIQSVKMLFLTFEMLRIRKSRPAENCALMASVYCPSWRRAWPDLENQNI
ncbi:hypothetical protein MHYP_G00053020 [Metynnis hypsauchen]